MAIQSPSERRDACRAIRRLGLAGEENEAKVRRTREEAGEMSYRSVVLRVTKVLERAKVPYLITGALAVACYGAPRATVDVDVMVPLGVNASPFISRARSAGFKLGKPIEKRIKQVFMEGGIVTLAFLGEDFSVDLIAREDVPNLIERARTFEIYGKGMRVISPEDLIVEKLLVWRGADLTDVARIIVSQWEKLDLDNLRKFAEKKGVTKQLEKILSTAKREISKQSG